MFATRVFVCMHLRECECEYVNVCTACPPHHIALSYPILSYPILSYPILSYPILSYPHHNMMYAGLFMGGPL